MEATVEKESPPSVWPNASELDSIIMQQSILIVPDISTAKYDEFTKRV